MNNIGCGCNQSPVFVTYPYTRGAIHQCDCCTQMHQPETAMYPSGGYMQENAYMIINDVPYLLDNTTTNYGTKISVSENVYTRISKRNDPSCINLTGSFDLTGDIIANNAWVAFLEEFVSSKYADLDGVLPIQKSAVRFRFYFHIEDSMGGVVYSNYVDSIVKNHLFHYTDINDFFVTSYKNIAVTNIPQVDYNGIYNLFIDKVEVYVKIVDTKEHVTDGLNPYYQWIANHTRISVQHDAIEPVTDGEIMIGACDIIWSTAVQLALTTRLKICFTVYLSNTIMNKNSFGVYKALTEPTQHTVDELAARIEALETTVGELTEALSAANIRIDGLGSIIADMNTELSGKINKIASLMTLNGTLTLSQEGETVETFTDIQATQDYLVEHSDQQYDLAFGEPWGVENANIIWDDDGE